MELSYWDVLVGVIFMIGLLAGIGFLLWALAEAFQWWLDLWNE